MKNNDKKQRGVAQKIGVSTSTLHDILRKDQIPSLTVAYEIEQYTRGAVTVYDWLDHRQEKNSKVSKTKADKKEKKIKK